MNLDLSMMYVIRAALTAIKKEMTEKSLTFDEFIEHYDEGIKMLEEANRTGSHV